MTQTQAAAIARSLGQRHQVLYLGQRWLVVNVSRALAVGTPVASLCLTLSLDAPLLVGGVSVPYRKVHVLPSTGGNANADS